MSSSEKRKTDYSKWYGFHLESSYEWSSKVIEYSTFVYHLDIDWDADNYLVIGEIYCFAQMWDNNVPLIQSNENLLWLLINCKLSERLFGTVFISTELSIPLFYQWKLCISGVVRMCDIVW